MIRFEIRIKGQWVTVDQGIVLGDGKRLAWWRGLEKGISYLSDWRLHRTILQDPGFKAALWSGLSSEEQVQAVTRRAPKRLAG